MENQIEIWKDIEGYEGLYQVSNFGQVKSFCKSKRKGKILAECINGHGYFVVILYLGENRKTKYNHRLVAETFFGKSDLVVNHKDGNTINNNIENLEYVSIRDNTIHSYKFEKTSSQYTGVSWNKSVSKWGAYINLNGTLKYLGCFNNELEAYNAYLKALEENGIESKYA
jgi:hypothetical protein